MSITLYQCDITKHGILELWIVDQERVKKNNLWNLKKIKKLATSKEIQRKSGLWRLNIGWQSGYIRVRGDVVRSLFGSLVHTGIIVLLKRNYSILNSIPLQLWVVINYMYIHIQEISSLSLKNFQRDKNSVLNLNFYWPLNR